MTMRVGRGHDSSHGKAGLIPTALSIDLWQPVHVMPTQSLPRAKAGVGIHDFPARMHDSRGWRAFARHDELSTSVRYLECQLLGVA